MPPELHTLVEERSIDSRLDLREGVAIQAAAWDGPQFRVATSRGLLEVDDIWLATGTRFDVEKEPLLSELPHAWPVDVAGGLPVLEPDLRWPGANVHILGGLAALTLGPLASDLVGGRRAACRIVPTLVPMTAGHGEFEPPPPVGVGGIARRALGAASGFDLG